VLIETFRWKEGSVATTVVHGSVTVGICQEGGDRLFDDRGALYLAQNHPNPFNATTVFDFGIIEPGRTQLSIFDMLGRRVATLLDDHLVPGSYSVTFDSGTLPSGVYSAVLTTPTAVLQRLVRLVK
jgi:hypothetical protein